MSSKNKMPKPEKFRAQLSSPDLNQGPLDLQSNALPTELFRHIYEHYICGR